MSHNTLRVGIQDPIIAYWQAEHPTTPIYFENCTKEPDSDFLLCVIDFGDTSQASIGSTTHLYRKIAAIRYILVTKSETTNSKYDSYLDTLEEIKTKRKITIALLRDFQNHGRTAKGDSNETIITQVFQYDKNL